MGNNNHLQTVLIIFLILGYSLSVCSAKKNLIFFELDSKNNIRGETLKSSFGITLRWNISLGGEERISLPVIVDLNSDGRQEILIEIQLTGFHYMSGDIDSSALYYLNHDGTTRWQHSFGGDKEYVNLSPFFTVADLKRDGELEILIGDRKGFQGSFSTYCLNKDNTLNWIFGTMANERGFTVGDFFQNGCFEILFASVSDGLYCLSDEGENLWNYTRDLGSSDRFLLVSNPVIADLDLNGDLEVLVAGAYELIDVHNPIFESCIYCFNLNNSLKWSFTLDDFFGPGSPVIGDLEGDGLPEVLFIDRASSRLFCLNASGAEKWRQQLVDLDWGWYDNEIALGDLTGDGSLEVLTGSLAGILYCFTSNGSELWQYDTGNRMDYSQPVIADLNNDSQFEVLFVSHQEEEKSILHCLDSSGQLLWEHPAAYGLGRGLGAVTVADLEGDGILEIICGQYHSSKAGTLCCFELTGVDSSGRAPWACYQGSLFRTGWGDSDSDLIDDFTEGWTFGTDPNNPDSDGDGFTDGEEYLAATDPLDPSEFPIRKAWLKPTTLAVIVVGTSILVGGSIITTVVVLRRRKKKVVEE